MPEQKLVSIRAKIPEHAHDKIRSHQRKLAAKHDRFVTFEEALIDHIITATPASK
jgi:hypothetical protein